MNTSYKKSQDIKNRQYLKEQAGNMFDKGDKYSKDIKVIVKCTNLTIQEIEELK